MKSHSLRLPPLVIFLLTVLSGAAQAAPHGIFWVQGRGPKVAAGNLLYYGGPVISNAKVYAVFWGDNVNAETQSKIGPFYANVLDSRYMDWLSEYNTNLTAVDGRAGTNQKIGRGSFAGTVMIQPSNTSKNLTDAMIQQELEAQIAAGKLPKPEVDENNFYKTLYMVYFPAGISITIENMGSCSSFCAYHEGFKSARTGASIFYGVMPVCGFGCGFGFNGLSVVSSHEAIEAITDPFPTPGTNPAYPQAWNTSGGDEIGDLCAGGSSTVTGHGITSAVQWEWDNSISACAKGPWTQSGTAIASLAGPSLRLALGSRPIPLLENAIGTQRMCRWDGR